MKTFIQAAGIFILIILTIFFMSGKFSSTTSETELQATLDKAVDHALYVAMTENVYTIDSKDELAADVMHELFTTCNTKAKYEIAFNEIDLENGLVDVQVTQTVYVSPLMHSEVTCRRTVIFEEFTGAPGSGEEEEPGEEEIVPMLAANDSWWNPTSSSTIESEIKTILFIDEYTGEYSESWPAGVDNDGDGENDDDVMCYLDASGENLRIVGNGFGKIFANPDSSSVFEEFTSLESITGLDIFDTSKATSMNSMFRHCHALTELDLSYFDTSNVTDMGMMFLQCRVLTNRDVSGFDTSNVENMGGMFSGCYVMTTIDLSNFDTANATDMSGMFSGCHSLTSLNISSFDTTNVTDMGSMFAECKSLTSLNLSHFNTSNVTAMPHMFFRCDNLASVNVTSFNTSNVTDMCYMFESCYKLTVLDLSSFDTSKLEDIEATEEMFYNSTSLTSIIARTEADKQRFNRVGNSVPEDCTITVKQ